MKLPSDIVVGQYLQLFTLTIAAAIAFVYTCGYMFGYYIHCTNEFITCNAVPYIRLAMASVKIKDAGGPKLSGVQ